MAKINSALIGCGYWGRNHLRTLSEMEETCLVAVCDSREPSVKIPGGVRFTQNYDNILNDERIDAVVIATPTNTHYELGRRALKAGKHTFIEKPLATTSAHARELCDLSQPDIKLMVGEIFRFNPAVRYIKNLLDKGNIGDLRYIESRRVGLGPVRNDVSALWDLATHDVYLSNLFVGKNPSSVSYQGVSHNGHLDDIVCLNLKFEIQGYVVMSSIYANWEHPIKERKIVVGGTKKAVLFDDVAPSEKLTIYERGVDYTPPTGDFAAFQAATRDGDIIIPKLKITPPLEEELRNFFKSIWSEEDCLSQGCHGLETVRVLEAAERSRKAGGIEVAI